MSRWAEVERCLMPAAAATLHGVVFGLFGSAHQQIRGALPRWRRRTAQPALSVAITKLTVPTRSRYGLSMDVDPFAIVPGKAERPPM
jgi:hypothetical protein